MVEKKFSLSVASSLCALVAYHSLIIMSKFIATKTLRHKVFQNSVQLKKTGVLQFLDTSCKPKNGMKMMRFMKQKKLSPFDNIHLTKFCMTACSLQLLIS